MNGYSLIQTNEQEPNSDIRLPKISVLGKIARWATIAGIGFGFGYSPTADTQNSTPIYYGAGCTSSSSSTSSNVGTRIGCEMKFRKMGYQRWQANDLCKNKGLP